jgi:hypothetical protein
MTPRIPLWDMEGGTGLWGGAEYILPEAAPSTGQALWDLLIVHFNDRLVTGWLMPSSHV